ncbi:kinetochore protein SPC24 homolog [Dioscorea cayenensis subsp. rotundata]|uniref:Kinetochore protein SPC24 homolog n=1 Tax=Dioscorea cayennensis subsp. rotundata TaxID=55577 RepID=A0AB40AXR0_DIOCR|nr:kinetochore protein SPC24 homolog [Dioscorea cayenensis subsp. rotundata]XP_039119782.1 kinetochore protein SPC24 homolog [Dioscorea cayenensis subsp. rotundata]
MENRGKRVDVAKLLSLGDDLIGVLNNRKDGDNLMQSLEGMKTLQSSCEMDSREVQNLLDDYQKRVDECKGKIEKAKAESTADAEQEHLQNELEEKLQSERLLRQELRIISDELSALERQRVSIEKRKEMIKKEEKDSARARDLLSMCASVTSIIPTLDDQTKISGLVVDRDKKKVEKFEFEKTLPPLEVCNRLWKMAQ